MENQITYEKALSCITSYLKSLSSKRFGGESVLEGENSYVAVTAHLKQELNISINEAVPFLERALSDRKVEVGICGLILKQI